MAKRKKKVKIIEGSTNILIIAPHCAREYGGPKKDINTDILADAIAKEIGCSAIIKLSGKFWS